MRELVISNTSPIFYLHRLGLLDLLEKLYGEIIIPNAVLEELEEGKKSGEDVPDVRIISWIKIRSISVPPAITIIPDLGKGESEALALALMEKQHLLIIDDALAREIAGLQSIRFTGTAGILLKAKKNGFINELKPVLYRLKDAGFYIRERLLFDLLKLSGEDTV
jgi:predicted nucleic acid-binding protein